MPLCDLDQNLDGHGEQEESKASAAQSSSYFAGNLSVLGYNGWSGCSSQTLTDAPEGPDNQFGKRCDSYRINHHPHPDVKDRTAKEKHGG
jgi:hypothetical protein